MMRGCSEGPNVTSRHREKDLEGCRLKVGGPYLGGQIFHQGHHGVLEECASCQGALGHLCDVLLPIWPHGPQGGIRAVDTGRMPRCGREDGPHPSSAMCKLHDLGL